MRHCWFTALPKSLPLTMSLIALLAAVHGATPTASPPKFDEVFQLIRTNLGGMNAAEVERAALKALLTHLDGPVIVEDGPTAAPARVSPASS